MAYTNVPSSSVVCLPSSMHETSSHPRRPLYQQILRSLSGSSNLLQLHQDALPPPFRAPPVPVMDDLLHHYKVPPPSSRMAHLAAATSTSSLRRHSIGAVIRQTDLTAADATPLVGPTGTLKGFRRTTIAEAAEPVDTTRKIKIKASVPMPPMRSSSNRDDILILTNQQSHVANLWANYLTSCFEQMCQKRNRPPFRILRVGLDDIVGSVPFALEERIVQVKLKLVIVCPMFLQQVQEQPAPSLALTQLLNPSRVLAMLLGVEEDQIAEHHRAGIASFADWKKVTVKNKDAAFVSEFLNDSMAILTKVAQEEQSMHQNRAAFSLQPKKVNNAHSKVLIMLTEPMEPEDKLKVTIIKGGEKIEVVTAKKRNPFTIMFTVPDSCLMVSMLVGVQIEKNGVSLGCRQIKCESRMRELDQLLKNIGNPLDFMSQTLGLQMGDRDQLDNFLAAAFQRNVPPNFNLLQSHDAPTRKSIICSEEFPTLLHFAAKFGLDKLVWQLLECPGGDVGVEIRNCNEHTPVELAEMAGHLKVANTIRGYTQMNEFTSIYSYMKMTAENKGKDSPDDLYNLPRPLNETYQVPPAARPLRKASTSSNGSSEHEHNIEYLKMNSLKKNAKKENQSPNNQHHSLSRKESGNSDTLKSDKSKHHMSEENLGGAHSSKNAKSREHLAMTPDDELVEIFNDFKNNVYTLGEVEKLVDSWKNRNDVQQSLLEKQEYFKQLRAEYDRIQQKMRDDMKRTTPFERLKKFIFRGKDKHTKSSNREKNNNLGIASSPVVVEPTIQHGFTFRPTSSLSINSNCSSSSSERMSTGSGCSGASLGDSGTHSDHEERIKSQARASLNLKEQPQRVEEEDEDSLCHEYSALQNYSVPPYPRPVMEAKNKRKMAKIHFEDLPPLPSPNRPSDLNLKEEDLNAYIIPGNLTPVGPAPDTPVTPQTADSEFAPDYMNWSAPQDKLPSYMNLSPPPVPPRCE